VPMEPLAVQAEVLRQGGRLRLLHATVRAGGEEYVRASALLLRPSADDAIVSGELPKPAGPDGLTTQSLMGGSGVPRGVPPGFHPRAEPRRPPRAANGPLAIWFRMPIPLIAGETPTALQQAVALADFANAIASLNMRDQDGRSLPYVNIDSTIYLT